MRHDQGREPGRRAGRRARRDRAAGRGLRRQLPGARGVAGPGLYARALTYSRCMRSHGVPDFPILKQGPGGSLVHPLSPPPGC